MTRPGSIRELDERFFQVRGLVTTLVAVVAAMLLASSGGLVWHTWHVESAQRLGEIRSAALDTGRSSAKVLLSYDYRTLKKDFKAGRAVSTGKFRAEYARTTSKAVAPNAKKLHVVVTAEVAASSVVNASSQRVELLLFVNQNTVSDLVRSGRVDQNRVLMTMVPVGGDWRVAKLTSL